MTVQSREVNLDQLGGTIYPDPEIINGEQLKWASPLEAPFHIAGFPWLAQDGVYRRLPLASKDVLPPAVDTLAYCTAGGQIRFQTNSSRLAIKVRLAGPANMYHMPPTGQCGFDCYLGEPGEQSHISTAKFKPTASEYESQLYQWDTKKDVTVTLNFPLYQGVEEVWIGVDKDAVISEAPAYAINKPVVIYGTSVTQGGCASRPGMAYSNILSRMIPVEFVNLGFSGSGKGEPELAHIISEISDPALYILDYEGNTGAVENITRTLPEFIRILRARHPEVPILVVSRISNAGDQFYQGRRELNNSRRLVQIENVEQRQAEGDSNIHFVDGSKFLGNEFASECTVDGVHPTDLGFLRMAQSLAPFIRPLLRL
ncbi:SGNH/GDSL hydrolase family protein [Paenibacillus dakarensis]|uniref:SGNH/GDSL hydrolase family protein n=1 Tax=Paenibacillus dakarensis TaxID=1527293 RepID=UPI0006D572E8|nr:SGNH/GDSL hydrolase family protein [Paenibacillus dakarensis]